MPFQTATLVAIPSHSFVYGYINLFLLVGRSVSMFAPLTCTCFVMAYRLVVLPCSMLYAYVMHYKDTDPVTVTYIVSGIVGSNGDTVS